MNRHGSSDSRPFGLLLPLVILIITLSGVASPQPGPGGGPPPWARERIQTVIIGKFSDELNLSEKQAEMFFPRFNQFQRDVEDLHRQANDRRQLLEELSRDPAADKGAVAKLLRDQSEHEQRLSTLKGAFLTDVSAFLTPQQVSRCSILLDELPRRVREFMEERRREQWREGDRPIEGQQAPGRYRRRGY